MESSRRRGREGTGTDKWRVRGGRDWDRGLGDWPRAREGTGIRGREGRRRESATAALRSGTTQDTGKLK